MGTTGEGLLRPAGDAASLSEVRVVPAGDEFVDADADAAAGTS